MSRVEWSRRTPEEIETVLGIMLCRENRNAIRVRPSWGDRGVDVYIPSEGKWTVYQIKSFTGSLTSSQKRQIKKSWDTFNVFVKEKGLTVEDWFLLRPENPTWEDQQYLEELTKGSLFRCAWKHLDFCERLASDHPSVVDYYLFDGKDRLQDALRDLMAATSAAGSAADMTTPGDASKSLESIHAAINAHDPHYRYDFSVKSFTEGELPSIGDEPNLLAATIEASQGRAVIFKIFARYREAPSDRPVPGYVELVAEPGTAHAEAVRDFVEYGLPISDIPAQDLSFDLPGGLGGKHSEGTVSFGGARFDTAKATQQQLVILDPNEDVEIAVANLDMDPPTTGLDGKRFAVSGQERHGVFSMTMRVDPVDMRLVYSFTSRELTGKSPADILPALHVIANLRPPNRFLVRVRNGPILDDPHECPSPLDDVNDIIPLCESLATIQRHTFVQIRVPDFTQTTKRDAEEWVRAGRLLNGDTVDIKWDRVGVELGAGADTETIVIGAFTIATAIPLRVSVGGVEIDLGLQLAQLKAARIDPEDLFDGRPRSTKVHFLPAGDNTATVRWIGRSEPQQE